ncbi:MAG: sulfite exporter TauE/SafE family protein [Spirosomataceae bacterium]
MGILNGLLPCGLVYMALISSVAMGNAGHGGVFMLVFGLGTLPAMSVVAFAKNLFPISLRHRVRRFMPAFVALVAIVLIVRGLEVTGWPLLGSATVEIPICHGR